MTVLDASVVLAHMHDEAGAAIVAGALASAHLGAAHSCHLAIAAA